MIVLTIYRASRDGEDSFLRVRRVRKRKYWMPWATERYVLQIIIVECPCFPLPPAADGPRKVPPRAYDAGISGSNW